ncbi:MAG: DUF2746 domain-containing protein [Micrococcaceae bacterium]|nr:DUF2746 domain-containing protein [Micrococcaceae bacterium]
MTPAEWLIAAAAVVTAVTVLWKPARKLFGLGRQISLFIDDWRGVPEELDSTGRVIRPGRRGAASVIEEVRHQVQNSHRTNLRDDLDRLHADVTDLKRDLREHIDVAREQEFQRDDLDAQVVNDVSTLRERYAPKDDE